MFKQEFFSIQAAAERRKVSIEELICLAEDGKISVCFRHYGCVGLFRTTADGEHIVGFSPCQANDDDMIPHSPGDVVIVSGVFRSFMRPAILCQHPAEVWLRPTAIEVVTVLNGSDQPPVVPDGFVLGRVDAASRCLDDSPVRIDDWLFCREDLDRLTEPAVEQPATPGSVAADGAPAVTDAAAGQGEALTPTTAREHDSYENLERLTEGAVEQPATEQLAAEQPAVEQPAAEGKPADGEWQAGATTMVPDEAQRQKPTHRWREVAREHANTIWLRMLNVCQKPSKEVIAKEIAGRLWREGFVTTRGKRISPEYVVRWALGKGWNPPAPD